MSGKESKVTHINTPASTDGSYLHGKLDSVCFSQEVKEEEGGSEGDPDDGMELKEDCGEGEGPYLSEVERAASESEDGYGPPSQRYTVDSLASSPASSSQL